GRGREVTGGAGGRPRREARVRLVVLGRLLDRIGTTGVAEVDHQVLDRLLRVVHVIVPPPAVVHEGLARGVVLDTLRAHRTGLVVGDEHTLEDVDVRRHPELLPARLAARLQLDGPSREQKGRVYGGGE